MSNFDANYFRNIVKAWGNQELIHESTININNYNNEAKSIINNEVSLRNIDLTSINIPMRENSSYSDKVVVYEGNAYEAIQLKEYLSLNNVNLYTNEDFGIGFNHNSIAQIAVDAIDEENTKVIISDYFKKHYSNIDQDRIADNNLEENYEQKFDNSIKPYNVELWKFIFLLIASPYLYLSYFIYRQWKYMNNYNYSGYKISPIFPALLQNLAFFKLYHFVFKVSGKYDDFHKFIAYLLPLISVLFSVIATRVPHEYAFIGFFAIIPLLPLVFEINRFKDCIKRKSILTISEIILLLIGITFYTLIYIYKG